MRGVKRAKKTYIYPLNSKTVGNANLPLEFDFPSLAIAIRRQNLTIKLVTAYIKNEKLFLIEIN